MLVRTFILEKQYLPPISRSGPHLYSSGITRSEDHETNLCYLGILRVSEGNNRKKCRKQGYLERAKKKGLVIFYLLCSYTFTTSSYSVFTTLWATHGGKGVNCGTAGELR